MTYHFHDNWGVRPKNAKIHHSNCSFCNCGKATYEPKENASNGTWHGPFATLHAAHGALRRRRLAPALRLPPWVGSCSWGVSCKSRSSRSGSTVSQLPAA